MFQDLEENIREGKVMKFWKILEIPHVFVVESHRDALNATQSK
jgi:hypothetical protein